MVPDDGRLMSVSGAPALCLIAAPTGWCSTGFSARSRAMHNLQWLAIDIEEVNGPVFKLRQELLRNPTG